MNEWEREFFEDLLQERETWDDEAQPYVHKIETAYFEYREIKWIEEVAIPKLAHASNLFYAVARDKSGFELSDFGTEFQSIPFWDPPHDCQWYISEIVDRHCGKIWARDWEALHITHEFIMEHFGHLRPAPKPKQLTLF